MRDLHTAMHEASHLVVGCALGLRVKRAVLEQLPGWSWSGGVWFDGRAGSIEAWALMYAAGISFERAVRGHARNASGDLRLLREIHVSGAGRVRALEVAARAILQARSEIHARVTCALVERDLSGLDVARLARGLALGEAE